MSSEIKLKSCPFCGGPAAIIKARNTSSTRWKFKVYCTQCQVRQILHKTKSGAIMEWNHRTKL